MIECDITSKNQVHMYMYMYVYIYKIRIASWPAVHVCEGSLAPASRLSAIIYIFVLVLLLANVLNMIIHVYVSWY